MGFLESRGLNQAIYTDDGICNEHCGCDRTIDEFGKGSDGVTSQIAVTEAFLLYETW